MPSEEVPKEPKILPAGTKITCPNCGALIATSRDPIVTGTILVRKAFEMHQEGQMVSHTMTCTDCGEPFYRGQLHTNKGWK